MNELNIIGIITGTIVSICTVQGFLIMLVNKFYFPRSEGNVLQQQVLDIKSLLLRIEEKIDTRQ